MVLNQWRRRTLKDYRQSSNAAVGFSGSLTPPSPLRTLQCPFPESNGKRLQIAQAGVDRDVVQACYARSYSRGGLNARNTDILSLLVTRKQEPSGTTRPKVPKSPIKP